MKAYIPIAILAVIFLIVVSGTVFVVGETEQVIITQFGKPAKEPIQEPGLYFKMPSPIQKANYFPKNILEWDGEGAQIPTVDKTYIMVDTFARWRIADAMTFFKKVTNERTAQLQLDSIVNAETKNLIQSLPLIETVRNSFREMEVLGYSSEEQQAPIATAVKVGREKMTQMIMDKAAAKLRELGIDLIDLGIKRLNYIQEVRDKVYERMIAERKQIAEKFRSEGQGESRQIEGRMERELKAIQSDSYRKSQEIMGKADAEAAAIYAEAYGRAPEFYSLVKTLDIYKELPPGEIEIILSTKSDLFKYLQRSEPRTGASN